MSSGGSERVIPVGVRNHSSNVMASSSTVANDDADADADTEDGYTLLLRIKTARKSFVTAVT